MEQLIIFIGGALVGVILTLVSRKTDENGKVARDKKGRFKKR